MSIPATVYRPVSDAARALNTIVDNCQRNGAPVTLFAPDHRVAGDVVFSYVTAHTFPQNPELASANAALLAALTDAHAAGHAMDCTKQAPAGFRGNDPARVAARIFLYERAA